VARHISSTIPHGVGMEASFSPGRDVTGWTQSKTRCKTLCENVVLRHCAQPNNRSLAADDQVLDTTSTDDDMEIKREEEQRKLHRMAKVHDVLEMCQGNENLGATQKESCTRNIQMTAIGFISDTEVIVKACWSNFQHDGAAAFKLSERLPLPQGMSAKDLPGGRT